MTDKEGRPGYQENRENMGRYIDQAVELALEYHKEHPVQIGALVAHPSDEYLYKLENVAGNSAFATRPDRDTGKTISVIFPLAEIFDYNVVKIIAIGLMEKDLSGFDHGVMIVEL